MARLEATVEDGKVTLTAVAPWRGWVNRFMGAGLAVGMCLGAGLGVVPEVQASPQSDSEKIAQLESQIAANRVKADQAKIAYAKTAESFAQATDDLNESEAQAKAASARSRIKPRRNWGSWRWRCIARETKISPASKPLPKKMPSTTKL